MNNIIALARRYGCLALVMVPAATLYSQAASPRASGSPGPASDEGAVQLSPFVVNSTKDTGYQATSTLAGTRLDTPLKDLGASISIYTKDFLDDINATNSSEFLQYATSMDASGPGGNFAGSTFNDINSAVPFPDGLRENPQGNSRSRGLAAPTFMRDLFISAVDIDTYNTDRITVLRGPNAALIGVSSPAGVTDTSLIRADLSRDKNRVALRYGNNESLRSTVDFNRVLIKDKLAARIAGLQMREEYNQRPAYEHKERIYGTVTFKPFKSTSLRGNFESGRMRADRPQVILPTNSIPKEWYNAGRPGFDWAFYDDPARNPNAATQNAGDFYPYYQTNFPISGPGVFVIYNNPTDQRPGLIIQSNNPTTNGTVGNALKNNLFHPQLNKDTAVDTARYVATRNIFEFPAAAYWIGGNVLPGNLPGFVPAGLKHQGFLDYGAFDFRNRMLDETGFFKDNFHGFNVTLEQSAWQNRLGVALAYDTQRQDRASFASFFSGNNNNHVRIDTTATGLDGLPNPNYGRPWTLVGAGYRWTHRNTDDETVRGTAFLKYDFKDLNKSWGGWIGRHTLSGVVERYRRNQIGTNPIDKIDGPVPRALNPNINARAYSSIVYIGPSIIGNNRPLTLEPIKIPMFPTGPIGDITYFSRAANETDPGTWARSPVSVVQILNSGTLSREVIKSKAANLQSYWLQEHIVTVLGWRRDTDYFASRSVTFTSNPADLNDPGQLVYGFKDLNFQRTPPRNIGAETKTYSVVVRWPQKLIKLPAGTDFSVFYNDSENFTPVGGRIDSFGFPLPVPRGTTKEYGLNFLAFNDKLSLRFNRYETANVYLSQGSSAFGAVVNVPLDAVLRWSVEGNVNPQLVAMRQADIATLLSALPANFLQLYNVTVTGTAPNITATRNSNLSGAADTTDFTAKGVELDIVYNPTPNVRILANVAKQETIKSNLLPFTKAYHARMKPIYTRLADRASGTYPTGWTPGTPLPANIETFGAFLDRTVEVPLATELASEGFPSAEQRKWRANLVANYTFGSGSIFGERLKGFGIGGGARWQSKFILGYPSGRNPDTTVTFDRSKPYYAPTEINVDAFMSYERKIWGDRINWKLQLNVSNIIGDTSPIPIGVQPWGEISAMRLPPERRWYLTNSFGF